ncbi:MAG: DNA-binding domain-containing protein [Mangrovibacterium sp.]
MANVLHKVKAYLYDNPLTDNPEDYSARVISERSLGIGEICDSAVSRGGADISSASMQHGVSLFLKEMAYQLCDGYSVNTGYFTAGPLIKGVFSSPQETFDARKHSLLFQFNQGDTLRDELPSVEVEIMGIADTGLSILQVTDVKTGSVNDRLTPGRTLKIAGYKVKLAGDNEDVGVYFVNRTSGESTRVDPSDMVTNNPSELIVMIPELAAGTYQLQVTTQYNTSTPLKEPRTVLFDKMLTVQ